MIRNAEVEGSIPFRSTRHKLDAESVNAYPSAVGGAARKS